jgi:hypothetical protein
MRLVMARPFEIRRGWELHLEGRALAERRLYPDAAAGHLHDLLGDGEAKTGAAFSLRVRVVHLMELFEHLLLLIVRYAGAGVRHGNYEVAVDCCRGDAHYLGRIRATRCSLGNSAS